MPFTCGPSSTSFGLRSGSCFYLTVIARGTRQFRLTATVMKIFIKRYLLAGLLPFAAALGRLAVAKLLSRNARLVVGRRPCRRTLGARPQRGIQFRSKSEIATSSLGLLAMTPWLEERPNSIPKSV
jgi:hypothetical protein